MYVFVRNVEQRSTNPFAYGKHQHSKAVWLFYYFYCACKYCVISGGECYVL